MTPSVESVIDLPDVGQIAYVVEDIERGMDRYIDLFGVEPWTVTRIEPPELRDTTYRGEEAEFGFRAGVAHAGETMLEFIEPTMGESIYSEHLDEYGPGMHHIAYFGWDAEETEAVVADLREAGIEAAQTGHFQGTDFWYFDTREELNGLMFETAIRRNVESRETTQYPPE
jgi:catechol 2,3-dioxygenase-like lactoylglutathione lyase family enzyme